MTVMIMDGNHLLARCLFAGSTMEIRPGDEMNDIDYQTLGYIFFASIMKEFTNLRSEIDEIILVADSKPSWRTHVYPKYKAHRKRDSKIDWNELNYHYDTLLESFKQNLPIKVLKIQSAEGDDIIGVLTHKVEKNFIIVSSDSDYKQCISRRVRVFDPIKRIFLTCEDPHKFLVESCLQGQVKDNIKNVLTPLDNPPGVRATPMGEKKIFKILNEIGLEKFLTSENAHARYNQNMLVMDLRKVPQTITKRVLEAYNNYELPNANNIIPYLMGSGWTRAMDNSGNIQEKLLALY